MPKPGLRATWRSTSSAGSSVETLNLLDRRRSAGSSLVLSTLRVGGRGVDQSERVEATVLSVESARRVAAVANLVKPGDGRGAAEFATRLLRPVRTLQALAWLSAQATAGQTRAHATLTAAADELLRTETRCGTAPATKPPNGRSIANAAVLDAPALVAAAWRITYLFAHAPQRRQALLGALLRGGRRDSSDRAADAMRPDTRPSPER